MNITQLKENFAFRPDFDHECRECGATPTVLVIGHECPVTYLCGAHFFLDREMLDWEKWNERALCECCQLRPGTRHIMAQGTETLVCEECIEGQSP